MASVKAWALATALTLGLTVSVSAQWPQWRGADGSGISREPNLPLEWASAADGKPARNIKWSAEIPGRGHSSPVVWGNRIFLTTSIKGVQVPMKKGRGSMKGLI